MTEYKHFMAASKSLFEQFQQTFEFGGAVADGQLLQAFVAKEREIAEATARDEGKPEAALPKIIDGRVTGFFKENCLVDQDFAKDSKQSVGKVLEAAGLKVNGFVRIRVGA